MKTKLFLFIAVFLTAFTLNAQLNSVAIVGERVGGWPDNDPLTSDALQLNRVAPGGDEWVRENVVVGAAGGLKFRGNNDWAVPYNWGIAASGADYPSNTCTINGNDIQGIPAGTYTVTFNSATGVYNFGGGPVIPVVKLIGSAVANVAGEQMTYLSGEDYELTLNLTVGSLKFDIDGLVYGSLDFPDGLAADPALSVPIATAKSYKVTYNNGTGAYLFADGIKDITIVGASTPIGWGFNRTQEETQKMVNKNNANENYYFGELPLVIDPNPNDNGLKFRRDYAWADAIGGNAFPIGSNAGSNVPVDVAGTYSCNLVRSTGAYEFFISKVGLVGAAVGGWDPLVELNLTSTDGGINYSLANVGMSSAECKFRLDNDWAKNWGNGGTNSWPSGTAITTCPASTNCNIVAQAGTYDVTFNRVTGAFAFLPAGTLATNAFATKAFSVSPNPSNNNWKISSANDITSVQVVNILGKVVYSSNTTANEINVDASALSNGVYFARIASANAVETVKLIKN
jgi:starch-binding outer membrane protein SusE/F